MNIDSYYPSKYLKASDVAEPISLVIEAVGDEQMRDGGSKPVCFFTQEERGLILNKTNSQVLRAAFGAETDAWAGKKIRLVSEKTDFAGKRVDAIRIQIPDPALDADVPF